MSSATSCLKAPPGALPPSEQEWLDLLETSFADLNDIPACATDPDGLEALLAGDWEKLLLCPLDCR